MKTVQSDLTFEKDKIVKVYNKSFKFYNVKNFKSECRVIKRMLASKHCVKVWNFNDNGYTMEKLDFALGDDRELTTDNVRRVFFSLGLESVLKMLDDMLRDLQHYGVNHRDINPGNILWSEKEGLLKFTDFAWAQLTDNPISCPGAVNHIYKTDDEHAILKIKNEITAVYKKMEPELENVYNQFQDQVAKDVHVVGKGRNGKVKGPYSDGSSIRRGWSYHIVDIPYFRKIQAHKNTCVDEYKLIKANLPVTPTSVLDIGCSAGYQIFNFLRDFDIKHAVGFENDIAVLNFLRSVERLYNLKQLDLNRTFDDRTEITDTDVTIWLNSHMWVYKQLGRERTLQAVRRVIEKSKVLFFQTAGDYSSSIYKVTEYKNQTDVKNMLHSAGGKHVTPLQTIVGMHGAPRDMFMVTK